MASIVDRPATNSDCVISAVKRANAGEKNTREDLWAFIPVLRDDYTLSELSDWSVSSTQTQPNGAQPPHTTIITIITIKMHLY